ncbi:MAG TPA: hypothetical protein VFD49_04740 [Candidatus Dormibacteraeota bacterium]|nr:hypothetical protein [Candidatus Dormibacteraeota bacterium]
MIQTPPEMRLRLEEGERRRREARTSMVARARRSEPARGAGRWCRTVFGQLRTGFVGGRRAPVADLTGAQVGRAAEAVPGSGRAAHHDG